MLAGLIWVVQIVIYPGFLKFREGWGDYHRDYMRRIGLVVMPLMFAELILAGARFFVIGPGVTEGVLLALVLTIWGTTFALQVPAHGRLQDGGWDDGTIQGLVKSNWIRTILWTIRLIFLTFMVLGGSGRFE
ncbi:MAG: hypothetical protein AAGJ79_13630 [Verrucomicrobiota bacterium]